MHPKGFFLKSPYGKPTIVGLGILLMFAILFLVELHRAHLQVNMATDKFRKELYTEKHNEKQGGTEQRGLWVEKWWISNQLAVAKLDSMSLGISFQDSTMQLLFKGLPLIKAHISHIWPVNMFKDLDYTGYEKMFSEPATIESQEANLPKKMFRKMRVSETGETLPVDSDSGAQTCLSWNFVTDNNLRLVVTGYIADSMETQPSINMVLIKNHIAALKQDIFYKKSYQPTIFIWLKDTDAKAIYRALPNRAKVIYRE